MKINMNEWKKQIIASPVKKAFPVLSFPCVQPLGISVRELVSDPTLQARGMKLVAERCDTAASVSMMDLSVEAEAFGSKVRFSDDEVPTVIGAIVEEPEDAEALQVPAVGAGRTGTYVKAIEQVCREITDRPVFAGVIGPFSLAGRLQGMSEIMVNCYDEPEMVEMTLQKSTEFIIEYIKAFKAAGANGVVMAEPAAGILSPAMMAEFSLPYVKQIVESVQDENFALVYHNCGNSVPFMAEQIAATGAWGYHFGDAVKMEELCRAMPADALVCGNVSPSMTFRAGTPEKMKTETLAVLNACKQFPNFVISSGCDIPPASPWENIDAFFKTVKEFYEN